MKSKLLLLSLLFFAASANSQNLKWLWGQSATDNNGAEGANIQMDAQGNIYVAGYFYGPQIVFGGDTLYNPDTSEYGEGILLLKYSAEGSFIFTKVLGCYNGSVQNPAMTIDGNNNIYLSGTYYDSLLVLDTGTLYNPYFGGSSNPFFLVKYSPEGALLWAKNGDTGITIFNMVTDAAGNLYLNGIFGGTTQLVWGPDTLTLGSTQGEFEAKMDSSGNPVWAILAGGSGSGTISGIAADAAGNTYITGSFEEPSVTIGGITLNDSTSNYEIFTAKLNPSGTPVWAQSSNGNGSDKPTAITVDQAGNVYITGKFNSDTLHFGNVSLPSEDSVGYPNYFIAKYSATGAPAWAQTVAAVNYSEGNALHTGANGTIYMTGFYSGPWGIYGNDTLVSNYTGQVEQLVICDYDTSGNIIWAAQASGPGGEWSTVLTTDAAGNVYVTGDFYGTFMAFGNDTVPGPTADEASNIFVARYGNFTTSAINNVQGGPTIIVYPNPSGGNFYFKGITPGSVLQVYDLTGQEIFSATVTDNIYRLNLSGKAQGIYLYHIIDVNNGTGQGKVVLN